MVYPKRIAPGVRMAEPVQLLDVMPTILDIAGIDSTGLLLQGRSLLPLSDGREGVWGRIALSEELTNFHGEEGREVWASVFFRDGTSSGRKASDRRPYSISPSILTRRAAEKGRWSSWNARSC